jgi:hypothetical protein
MGGTTHMGKFLFFDCGKWEHNSTTKLHLALPTNFAHENTT